MRVDFVSQVQLFPTRKLRESKQSLIHKGLLSERIAK